MMHSNGQSVRIKIRQTIRFDPNGQTVWIEFKRTISLDQIQTDNPFGSKSDGQSVLIKTDNPF